MYVIVYRIDFFVCPQMLKARLAKYCLNFSLLICFIIKCERNCCKMKMFAKTKPI